MTTLTKVNGIYAGEPLYQQSATAIGELKNSGYNTVIVWNIHICENGSFTLNEEFPLIKEGQYVGYNSYPYYQCAIADLKKAPTSVQRIEFSIGSSIGTTFANIKSLVDSTGTGSDSILYRNFQTLKSSFPEIDAINYDDEVFYDTNSAVLFSTMLADLGFKITLCPYTNQSFWSQLTSQVNNKRPGTIEAAYLQCYEGGNDNNPCDWDLNGIPVYPGLHTEFTLKYIKDQLLDWKKECDITGGWMWRYENMVGDASQYANIINNIFGIDDFFSNRIDNIFKDGIDAAFAYNGEFYLFYGNKYYQYSANNIVNNIQPKNIVGNWNLPEDFYNGIDAAFIHNGILYFFKDDKYARYSNIFCNHNLDYIKEINGHWGNLPSKFNDGIDAAFSYDGKCYLFNGSSYVRYSDSNCSKIDYHKEIEGNWGNLPSSFNDGLDAAFVAPNNKIYLFKGEYFVRYSDKNHNHIDYGFPQKIK